EPEIALFATWQSLRKTRAFAPAMDCSALAQSWCEIAKAFDPSQARDARGRWYREGGEAPYGHVHGSGRGKFRFTPIAEDTPYSRSINNWQEVVPAALEARETFRRSGNPEHDEDHKQLNSDIQSLTQELKTTREAREGELERRGRSEQESRE